MVMCRLVKAKWRIVQISKESRWPYSTEFPHVTSQLCVVVAREFKDRVASRQVYNRSTEVYRRLLEEVE